jgi:hypothetical protein
MANESEPVAVIIDDRVTEIIGERSMPMQIKLSHILIFGQNANSSDEQGFIT